MRHKTPLSDAAIIHVAIEIQKGSILTRIYLKFFKARKLVKEPAKEGRKIS